MKLYDEDGKEISWLTLFVLLIVLAVMWLVLGCWPVGIVFLIAGAEAAHITAAIWTGFVGALFVVNGFNAVRKARKNAGIHGK